MSAELLTRTDLTLVLQRVKVHFPDPEHLILVPLTNVYGTRVFINVAMMCLLISLLCKTSLSCDTNAFLEI